jgi:hypothetical protein
MSGDRRGQPLSAFARKILKLNRESPLLMPPGVTRGRGVNSLPIPTTYRLGTHA